LVASLYRGRNRWLEAITEGTQHNNKRRRGDTQDLQEVM
jgi:hypothetical protein